MSKIDGKAIRKAIKDILVGADLSQLTSKKVRKQLEQTFNVELTNRKKEIDTILMKEIEEANQSTSHESEDSEAEEEKQEESGSDASGSSLEDVKKSKSKARTPKRHASPDARSKAKSKKSKTAENADKPKKKTGFSQDMALSQELTDLFGTDKLPRCDVVKKMYALFRERNLMDPSNKQFVICDEELYKIFGVKRFRAFGMMKYLKHHVKDPKLIQETR